MYYTRTNPLDGKPVYVADSVEEKAMQRALLQFNNKAETGRKISRALIKAGRQDLIGRGPECLVPEDTEVESCKVNKKIKR